MKRIFLVSLVVATALAGPANIFEIDISPEEAQKYIDNPPFQQPQLSGRTATLPLVRWNDPRFRSGEGGPTNGHYWKNGKEIDNTEDYVEEVYDATQFHGQDGLGKYAYGYSAPESSKVENRERSGDVKGSYTYRDANNNDIQVRYWADSEGFHQEDNLPKVELQPVQESPEVREARLAHEKAWQEAAAAAASNPDPQGEYDPAKYEYEHAASEQQGVVADARQAKSFPAQPYGQQQAVAAHPKNQPTQQLNQQQQYSEQKYRQQQQIQGNQIAQVGRPNQFQQKTQGQQQQQEQSYQQKQSFQQQGSYQQNQYGQQKYQEQNEAEPTGPPRGFFYSFNYPVSVLVSKNAQGQQGGQLQGTPIDHDTVGVSAQRNYG